MEKQLPKNWVETNIETVTSILDNMRKPVNTDERNKKIGDIPYYGATGQTGWIDDYIFNEELVLVGEDGAPFFDKFKNVAYLINGKSWVNNHAHVLKGIESVLENKFLLHFFNQFDYTNYVGGTTRLKLNQTSLKSIPFLLPPLPEQNRIVTKLDALFAQLETIKSCMANVPLLLKDFRQQVLTQAVTGKLTEEWRKGKELEDMFDFISRISKQRSIEYEKQVILAKKEKLKKPKKDFDFVFKKHSKKEKWCIAKLDNLVYMSARIGWKGLKAEEYTESGPLFISVHSLNYGENVNYEKAYHISEERFIESPEIMLKENDILLCKDGAGIGKLGIVKNLTEKATVNSSLLVIRGREAFVNKFLFYFFSGPALQNIAKERITGTAIPHLFQRDIKEFYVDIPPIEEQQEIVSRVESLFAIADAIEKQYGSLKAKIDNLPQALLHKAFKGELTEQLESDGDASELLKEIEALKAVSGKVKKGGKVVKSYEIKDEVLGMVAEPEEKLLPKVVKLKPTNTEIYKRTLLAAEIVYQLKDTNTLGHLKLQKMLYLCQEIGSMNLPMNFLKQAMGPYDNQLARSLDKQFVLKKWFEYQNGALLKYKPLENCGKHKDDFLKFFESEIEQINYLINKFTKFTSNQIEAVATLYACWKEAIEQKELITDKLIITKFYQWSKEKEKFREENLIKALAWMRRNGVEPR